MLYLTLVKDLLCNLALKRLGGLRTLKKFVLSEGEEGLEDKLTSIEAGNPLLPLEARSVDEVEQGLP